MSPKPSPRPALRKAPDSGVHPAAPRLVAVMPEVPEVASAALAGKKKGGKDSKDKDEPEAELVVKLPKPLRKKLKAKAQEHGLTAEDATYVLIRVWVDG